MRGRNVARTCLLMAALGGFAGAAAAPADPEGNGLREAVDRLAAGVDRIGALLEQESRSHAADREALRVQVVAGILAVRVRKVDELEASLRSAEEEEQDLMSVLPEVREQAERARERLRQQGGELGPEWKEEAESAEAGVRRLEERLAQLATRRLALQGDLGEARKRVSRLEAILEDWLDRLE